VNEWQIQEAKSKFSALIHDAQDSPQTITRHGEPVAVVLSASEYDRLSKRKGQTFLDLLRSAPLGDLDLERDRTAADRKVDL
jgi:prevent-host-death family protein